MSAFTPPVFPVWSFTVYSKTCPCVKEILYISPTSEMMVTDMFYSRTKADTHRRQDDCGYCLMQSWADGIKHSMS